MSEGSGGAKYDERNIPPGASYIPPEVAIDAGEAFRAARQAEQDTAQR